MNLLRIVSLVTFLSFLSFGCGKIIAHIEKPPTRTELASMSDAELLRHISNNFFRGYYHQRQKRGAFPTSYNNNIAAARSVYLARHNLETRDNIIALNAMDLKPGMDVLLALAMFGAPTRSGSYANPRYPNAGMLAFDDQPYLDNITYVYHDGSKVLTYQTLPTR